MRVLMTADTVGGVFTYAIELCRALLPHGIEVALATMGSPPSADQAHEAEALPNVRLHGSGYRLEWMSDPWEDVRRAGDWLLELAAELRPVVVHLNGYAHGNLPFPAPVLAVGHSCVLSWWRAVHGADAPPRWARYREAVAAGLRAVHRVVAPSAAMLSALVRHYGPLPLAQVIPNGRAAPAAATVQRARERFVFAAGRLWDPAKGIDVLARSAPHLAWPVYVAGDTADPSGRDVRLEGIHPLGRLPAAEVLEWLTRAPIYALPARYEPFGLSILEAAQAGCALVIGDIPSLRELWEGAALFVPPGDEGALTAALQCLIDDPWRRLRLSAAARARARRYTPERMAQGYLSAYRALLCGDLQCAS